MDWIVVLLVLVVLALLGHPHHGVHLLAAVAQQALDVAHELVDVALARGLDQDVLVVVVAETPRHLLVVHLGLVLAVAPPPGHLDKVD